MAKTPNLRANEYNNSGFSTRTDNQPERLINQDGSVNVKKTGLRFFDHFSIFHFLVSTNWTKFNLLVIFSYLMLITFFGCIYYAIGVEKLGLVSMDFSTDLLNSIYFSSQTFSTVGYGRANPLAHDTNLIAVAEMLIGMMYLALAAGLLFARFSRPVAKIIFSKKALIAPYRQGKGFMIRLSNAKTNILLEVEVKVLLVMVVEENGNEVRKFYDLPLEMNKINMLAMTWTVVHAIDETSPLYEMNSERLKKSEAEFMVLIKGFNDTLSQGIHSRTSYKSDEIEWDARFSPVFKNINGVTEVAIDRISDYEKVKI
jgi:inward rectifier potassium channel